MPKKSADGRELQTRIALCKVMKSPPLIELCRRSGTSVPFVMLVILK